MNEKVTLQNVRAKLQSALAKADALKKYGRESGVIVQDLWSDVKRVIEYIDKSNENTTKD